MPHRTFKDVATVAGTPQPLIFTQLTAIAQPAPGSDDAQNRIPVNLAVGDSSICAVGDWIRVGSPGAEERRVVIKIPDATHITVTHLTGTYQINAFVRQSSSCHRIYVQAALAAVANDILYIGNSNALNKGTGAGVIKRLQIQAANVQQTEWDFEVSLGANALDFGDYWVDSTTSGDKYTPSFYSQ